MPPSSESQESHSLVPSLKISQILRELEAWAPGSAAEPWDNVGLLCGDALEETRGVIVSVDLTVEAIEEARARGFRLILNHHPCIFPKQRGLSRVVRSDSGGSELVYRAIREGIAVVACHTNFDRCVLEAPQAIARGLGARPLGRLIEKPAGSCVKLVVFVPSSHLEQVRVAVCEAGAGKIGDYDFCTFAVEGEGSFRGGEATSPYIGEPGKLEFVDELRLELVFPRGLEKAVVSALAKAHPYEEPAFDLIPVEQAPSGRGLVRGLGYGFWGELEKPARFGELRPRIEALFETRGGILTAPPGAEREIRRLGFSPGKGSSFVAAAAAAGCDLFITGEVGYHSALEGARKGMLVLELGHRESELFFLSSARDWVEALGLEALALNSKTQRLLDH
jgi:dinuclear metal center YbgI/SA1388 family protein